MKIILLGYMASGKSLIGKKLAQVLNYKFIDLDTYIEGKEDLSIPEIFDKYGELYFRKKEKHYLNELISRKDHIVLSLGGGTPCYYNNIKVLTQNEELNTVYLKVTIPELVKRLQNEKAQRPLISHIKTQDELTEFIGKHLFERSSFYNQAQYIINAEGKVESIIEEIIFKLF